MRNNKHPGRTRGLGLYVPWKHGFSEDSEAYRSRKRAKAERDARLQEEICESLREEITDVVKDEMRRQIEIIEERLRGNHLQALAATVLASPPKHPSSCASNHNLESDDRFPVDDILVMIIISGMLDPLIACWSS